METCSGTFHVPAPLRLSMFLLGICSVAGTVRSIPVTQASSVPVFIQRASQPSTSSLYQRHLRWTQGEDKPRTSRAPRWGTLCLLTCWVIQPRTALSDQAAPLYSPVTKTREKASWQPYTTEPHSLRSTQNQFVENRDLQAFFTAPNPQDLWLQWEEGGTISLLYSLLSPYSQTHPSRTMRPTERVTGESLPVWDITVFSRC